MSQPAVAPSPPRKRPLYYMAPIANASSIAIRGIVAFSAACRLRPRPVSIADPGVNERRDDLALDGVPLHDFVPLYWATHTPMQYVITQKRRWIAQDDLVFFEIDDGVLDIEGTWMSDGHAVSDDTEFYEGTSGWDEVDWEIVDTYDCWSKEYRRRKAAEVLVYGKVPQIYITRICVRSARVRVRLRRQINEGLERRVRKPEIAPIVVGPDLYY